MATILVVDDVAENVAALDRALRRLGYDVLSALDGPQALALAQAKCPDVILLDILMPRVDGIEVCRRLKRTPATRAIPIILVSGLAHEEHVVKGLDAGAVDYITKPFNDAILAARVRSALRVKEAYDAVQASAQLRSDLLATTSDELRTPLTTIIEFTDNLLASGRSEEERRAAINGIRRTGDRLLRIVQDIRDMSDIEAGRIEAELSECSPLEVIADVGALMNRHARAKGLQLDVEFAGPIPERMRTDPVRLRQILFYLVGNALKFTDGGSVGVRARFLPASELGSALQFEVVDSGMGMCGGRAAERYGCDTEIDPSTARDLGAAGFALAISSHLTAVLGGRMSVTCGPDAGCRVRVTVPTGPLDGVPLLEQPEPSAPRRATDRVGTQTVGRLEGCRILFAEDELATQKALSRALTNAGATVTVAVTGPAAVALALAAAAAGNPFDVLVVEMHLSAMAGESAVQQLRSRGYGGPIVVLAEVDRCASSGAGAARSSVVVKPVDPAVLIDTIATLQRGRGEAGDTTTPACG
jgi:DNA-binding response OmpR family regulator